jgi:hypothetical protein
MQDVPCVHSRNLQSPGYSHDAINAIMKLDWYCTCMFGVPDRRRQILLRVVLVRRWVTWVLGIWRGEGLGKGLRKGRSVYKQPETEVDGSCHS